MNLFDGGWWNDNHLFWGWEGAFLGEKFRGVNYFIGSIEEWEKKYKPFKSQIPCYFQSPFHQPPSKNIIL